MWLSFILSGIASVAMHLAGSGYRVTSNQNVYRSLGDWPPQPLPQNEQARLADYVLKESLCDPNPFDPPEDWVRLGIDITNREKLWKIAKKNSASWLVGNFEDEGDHMLSPFSWQAAHARIQMDMMTGQIPAVFVAYYCAKGKEDNACTGWGDRLKGALGTYKLALMMGWSFLLEISHPFRASDTQYSSDSFRNAFIPKYLFWNKTEMTDSDIRFIEKIRGVNLTRQDYFTIWKYSERDERGFPKFSNQRMLDHWGAGGLVQKSLLVRNMTRISTKSPSPDKATGILGEYGSDPWGSPKFLGNVVNTLLPWYESQLDHWNTSSASTDAEMRYRMLVTQIWSKIKLMLKNKKEVAEKDVFGNPPVALDFDMSTIGANSFIVRRHHVLADSCIIKSVLEPSELLMNRWRNYTNTIFQPTETTDTESPMQFPTKEDMTTLLSKLRSSWLVVGLHIRAGDDAPAPGVADSRFNGSETHDFLDCFKTTVQQVTKARCSPACPWKGILVLSSSDYQGGLVVKRMASSLNDSEWPVVNSSRNNSQHQPMLRIGPDEQTVPVRFVDLSEFRSEEYSHVGHIQDDVGYKKSIETFLEMLALGSSDILIRGESGFNYIAQLFGGIDTSFTASVSKGTGKRGRQKICSHQKLYFMLGQHEHPPPLVKEPDVDDDFYQFKK